MAIGTIPVTKDNTVSGASGPSKAAPTHQYSPSKLGEGQVETITDGHTKVIQSKEGTGSKAGDDIARVARQAFFNQHGKWPPCINTDCKSYGRPHPNCLCFGPLSQAGKFEYASGGQVCSGIHKENCEHFADGEMAEENASHLNNPQEALDNVGAQHGLLHILTKLGNNGRSQNDHKYLEDYIDSSRRGKKSLDGNMSQLLSDKMDSPPKTDIEPLKNHLEELGQNPEKAFNVGGNLGQILPDHAAAVGAKTANALNYFQSLKPKSSQNSPLDPVIPPTKAAKNAYDRQLKIAEDPMLILNHVKQGTIQPQDLKTLHTVYPSLGRTLTEKAAEALMDAKEKGKAFSRKERHGLSVLLGQPLDSTQTPMVMQAIIKANAPQQSPEDQGKPKKASGTELKQIDKVNDMLATPDQKRLMRKS